MAFKDLDEVLGRPKKQLPVGGKMLTFPDRVSAKTGMLLLRIGQAAKDNPDKATDGDALIGEFLDDAGVVALQEEILGRQPDDFIADGLDGDQVAHLFKTLVTWHLYGQDAAERVWAGNPPAPNREARRSKGPVKSNPARGSRGGSTTRARKKAASPGPSSSATGT